MTDADGPPAHGPVRRTAQELSSVPGLDPSEIRALQAVLEAFDAEILPIAEPGTCSNPERHAVHHAAHPVTRRVTCSLCFPPAVSS
jgi:hypothetical protein